MACDVFWCKAWDAEASRPANGGSCMQLNAYPYELAEDAMHQAGNYYIAKARQVYGPGEVVVLDHLNRLVGCVAVG